jgi:hypothetical protein
MANFTAQKGTMLKGLAWRGSPLPESSRYRMGWPPTDNGSGIANPRFNR